MVIGPLEASAKIEEVVERKLPAGKKVGDENVMACVGCFHQIFRSLKGQNFDGFGLGVNEPHLGHARFGINGQLGGTIKIDLSSAPPAPILSIGIEPCHLAHRRLTVLRSIPWKQLLISAGVVAVMVWRIPLASLSAAFRHMEIGSLSRAVLFLLVLMILRAYKWHRLMGAAGEVRLRQSLRSLFGGFALGLITPGRLGELGRCVFVRQDERAQVALLTVLDRLLDFWALLTLVGASLFLLTSRPAAIFGVAVWFASLPVVMGFPALVTHLSQWARRSAHFRGHFLDSAAHMPQLSTPRFALLAMGAMAAELGSFFFLLRAFSPTGFTTALATYPYIVLAGDLPVSFSGMGVREGVAAMLLSPYSVPAGAAVGASLVWFVLAVLMPAVMGAAWLVAERVMAHRRRLDRFILPADPVWAPAAQPLTPEIAAPPCELG